MFGDIGGWAGVKIGTRAFTGLCEKTQRENVCRPKWHLHVNLPVCHVHHTQACLASTAAAAATLRRAT